MLSKINEKVRKLLSSASLAITIYGNKVLAATAPTEDEVDEIASKGVKIFFGALAGFAVVFGGIELYGAFMAHRENVEQGGFGEARDKVQKKIIAGVMCLIAAVIIFIVMHWTQALFDIA
ncbi:MAG: hypothetical protein IJ593_09285 [Lachnospiraceae bacterium]|nr:hypothetical protein [Lachnospiraceae bacterium]